MVDEKMKKTIRQLHGQYHKAYANMTALRDLLFPVGMMVYNPMIDQHAIIKSGSLYADQVNTHIGHMSWYDLQKPTPKEKHHE